VRIVAADKLNVGLVEHRGDRNRPRKAVELGDDEDGFRALGMGEGFAKLGPIVEHVALAGLNLGILGEQCCAVADVLKHGGALAFQAEVGTCPGGR
jgi:hypothetical protein